MSALVVICKFGISARAARKVVTAGCLYVAVPVQVGEAGVPELDCPKELRATYVCVSGIEVFAPGASQSNEGLNSMIGTVGCRSTDREQIGVRVMCHVFVVTDASEPVLAAISIDEVPMPNQDDYRQGNVVWAKIL